MKQLVLKKTLLVRMTTERLEFNRCTYVLVEFLDYNEIAVPLWV